MLALLDSAGERIRRGGQVDGAVRRSHEKDEAARILCERLAVQGLSESDLALLPKGDPRKVALASTIRERTIAPNEWIAQNLHLGHVTRASRCWKPEASDLVKSLRRILPKALS
jgi:hypothetical protein